jgi:flavodoxin
LGLRIKRRDSVAKVLVVFYSRTGTTRRLASAIAQAGGWDLEELYDTCDRSGVLGFVRSLFDAGFGTLTRLETVRHDPSSYDLVLVGTPIWNSSLSNPVLTYVMEHRHALPDLGIFTTHGGRGERGAIRQLLRVTGKLPFAELTMTNRQIDAGRFAPEVHRFVDTIQMALTSRPISPPPSLWPSAPPPTAPPPL